MLVQYLVSDLLLGSVSQLHTVLDTFSFTEEWSTKILIASSWATKELTHEVAIITLHTIMGACLL